MRLRVFATCSLVVMCCLVATVAVTGQDDAVPTEQAEAKPTNPASYYIGLSIGEQFRNQGVKLEDIDLQSLVMGIADELSKKQPRLNEDELKAAAESVQSMMADRVAKAQAAMQAKFEAEAKANKEKAELFLAENKKKEGVKVLETGLQYKVERAGSGPAAKANSKVRVHYTGKLLDGTVFDSSVQRGQPAEFNVNGLIDAWQQALPRMKVGDKWTLYVPPSLGYGEQGSPPVIGPNDLLIFELELLDIVQ